jgi:hypothetical protein
MKNNRNFLHPESRISADDQFEGDLESGSIFPASGQESPVSGKKT